MRMRRKKWARPELAACRYYIKDPFSCAGSWGELFAKKQPIHLELGCGKGVFLAQLAAKHPEINYIGVDVSDDVLGVARREIERVFESRPVENVVLTRMNAQYASEAFTSADGIERIYICFCTPWPRSKHHKRRLTHPRQLAQYRTFLRADGEIHFKTDDPNLFADSRRYFLQMGYELVYQTEDLHGSGYPDNILTEHEIRFCAEGKPIRFLIAKQNL